MHRTRSFDCQPHRIQYVAILTQPQQLIRHSYHMDVRMFSVVEVSVRSPNLIQHLFRRKSEVSIKVNVNLTLILKDKL